MSVTCNDIKAVYDDVYFCQEFDKNEYDQVWLIAGSFMLITLGITFANFTQFAHYMSLITKMVSTIRSGDDATAAEEALEAFDPENIAGYSISQYIVLNAGLILIYFIAKILLITDESLKDANKNFDNSKWHEWVDTHNILIMYIFTSTSTTSSNILQQVQKAKVLGYADQIHPMALFLCIVFVADILGSFIMVCIKYGFLVLALYYGAVAMLCGFMLGVTFCCWLPAIFVLSFVLTRIFKQFACGKAKCEMLLGALASALALYALVYFLFILVLIFMWLFVGGPEDDIIYLVDESHRLDIFWCLVAATVYGFLIMLGGFARSATL